jgi:hypothetical protein
MHPLLEEFFPIPVLGNSFALMNMGSSGAHKNISSTYNLTMKKKSFSFTDFFISLSIVVLKPILLIQLLIPLLLV